MWFIYLLIHCFFPLTLPIHSTIFIGYFTHFPWRLINEGPSMRVIQWRERGGGTFSYIGYGSGKKDFRFRKHVSRHRKLRRGDTGITLQFRILLSLSVASDASTNHHCRPVVHLCAVAEVIQYLCCVPIIDFLVFCTTIYNNESWYSKRATECRIWRR